MPLRGAAGDLPVAASSRVSEVEVSLSTVIELKVASVLRCSMRCSIGGTDGRVGEDVDQHRGHVGGDHARAFGDACDMDRAAVTLDRRRSALGEGVGGHHRLSGHVDAVFAEASHEGGQGGSDAVMRQRFTDDAGRGGEHAVGRDTQRGCGFASDGGDRCLRRPCR